MKYLTFRTFTFLGSQVYKSLIYAAPFILLSLICFLISLGVPNLRRLAFRALVAPVAFGFSAILGWISFAMGLVYFKFDVRPATRPAFVLLAGLVFWALPGCIGAWLSIAIVKKAEEKFFKTSEARQLAQRVVVALISFLCGSFISLGLTESWLPTDSFVANLGLPLLGGASIGIVTFFLAKYIQRRSSSEVRLLNE